MTKTGVVIVISYIRKHIYIDLKYSLQLHCTMTSVTTVSPRRRSQFHGRSAHVCTPRHQYHSHSKCTCAPGLRRCGSSACTRSSDPGFATALCQNARPWARIPSATTSSQGQKGEWEHPSSLHSPGTQQPRLPLLHIGPLKFWLQKDPAVWTMSTSASEAP